MNTVTTTTRGMVISAAGDTFSVRPAGSRLPRGHVPIAFTHDNTVTFLTDDDVPEAVVEEALRQRMYDYSSANVVFPAVGSLDELKANQGKLRVALRAVGSDQVSDRFAFLNTLSELDQLEAAALLGSLLGERRLDKYFQLNALVVRASMDQAVRCGTATVRDLQVHLEDAVRLGDPALRDCVFAATDWASEEFGPNTANLVRALLEWIRKQKRSDRRTWDSYVKRVTKLLPVYVVI